MSVTTPDMAACAVTYTGAGWPVFPVWGLRPHDDRWVCRCPTGPACDHPGKHPHASAPHGFHDATTDAGQITEWWARDRTANIGLACGHAFDVLDIDSTDLAEGVADLPDCETDGGPVVITGSGRWHLYFAPTGIGRRIGIVPRVDWLGAGGYVIAPPSRHASGGHYEWYGDTGISTPLTRPPQPLLDLLAHRAPHDRGAPGVHRCHTWCRRTWLVTRWPVRDGGDGGRR